MTSIFDRDPTPEDLEAERDPPRPGVWAVEQNADLRTLTHDETDLLIRRELLATATPTEMRGVLAAIGGHLEMPAWPAPRMQRGGIDTDPLVRVLARRAWGERDRVWFERRGMRAGDRVHVLEMGNIVGRAAESSAQMIVAKAWPHETAIGEMIEDARPGALVHARMDVAPMMVRFGCQAVEDGVVARCRVSDRVREPPASLGWPEAGISAALRGIDGHPPPSWAANVTMTFAMDLEHSFSALLGRAMRDAAVAGVPTDTMWVEHVQGDALERRLMAGLDGVDTPVGLRQEIARVWIEQRGTGIDIRLVQQPRCSRCGTAVSAGSCSSSHCVAEPRPRRNADVDEPAETERPRCGGCGALLIAGACSTLGCFAKQPRR